MTRIVWSPKSLRDLQAIEAYIAQFNPVAAKIDSINGRPDLRSPARTLPSSFAQLASKSSNSTCGSSSFSIGLSAGGGLALR